MGSRGPVPQFDRVIEVSITKEMADHLDRFVQMVGCSRAEVVRGLIQDSRDKATGTYDPLPSGFSGQLKQALRKGN